MRKTMFRGKNETNGQWYEGDFITDTNEFNRTCDKAFILPHWDKLNWPISVIKETVGQYIGKNDDHGTEIFAGDLVQVTFKGSYSNYWTDVVRICEVKYDEESASYFPFNSCKSGYPVEVIGNIHEHSHLLEDAT